MLLVFEEIESVFLFGVFFLFFFSALYSNNRLVELPTFRSKCEMESSDLRYAICLLFCICCLLSSPSFASSCVCIESESCSR